MKIPTENQRLMMEYFKNDPDIQLMWNGRRPKTLTRYNILRIIWAIGTASSDTVHLQMGDEMHLEVYRSTLTTMFPGCVIAQKNMTLEISTQCVRDTIAKKGVEALKNIEKVTQKSVAEYNKQHYNNKQQRYKL